MFFPHSNYTKDDTTNVEKTSYACLIQIMSILLVDLFQIQMLPLLVTLIWCKTGYYITPEVHSSKLQIIHNSGTSHSTIKTRSLVEGTILTINGSLERNSKDRHPTIVSILERREVISYKILVNLYGWER